MLRIAKEYYLDSDSYNFTLYERKISQGEKNKGKEYFKALGYYGSIKILYKFVKNTRDFSHERFKIIWVYNSEEE